VEAAEQNVYFVEKWDKTELLVHLLGDEEITRALIFARTKMGADRVTRHLTQASIPVRVIHGDRTQEKRTRALDAFKTGDARVLVATDIASRGLDIDDVSHVINFDLPDEPEVYVHRIGRTARAGASGIAIAFCSFEERPRLRSIERLIRQRLRVLPTPGSIGSHPIHGRPRKVSSPAAAGPTRTAVHHRG
jgi:ATP-dependent RNA helicase RhlE